MNTPRLTVVSVASAVAPVVASCTGPAGLDAGRVGDELHAPSNAIAETYAARKRVDLEVWRIAVTL
jgi:hypothetical protein